jgi:voltage-gated potassium channel Kch
MPENPPARARRPARLTRAYLGHRHALLFYSLLLTLGAGPLVSSLGYEPDVTFWFLGMNLLAAVSGVEGPRRSRPFLVATVVVLVLARPLAAALHSPGLAITSLLFWVAIGVFAAARALRFAMRARRIDAEHVYAALSAYLLAGVLWGVLYRVIESAFPGSFATSGTATAFSIQSAIYFSFVTLATLGYGDIVPRSEVARGVAIVEAVAGQLYLAVLVARLVSLYTHRQSHESES